MVILNMPLTIDRVHDMPFYRSVLVAKKVVVACFILDVLPGIGLCSKRKQGMSVPFPLSLPPALYEPWCIRLTHSEGL